MIMVLIDSLPILAAVLLSLILPIGIFVGRSNIRASRYEIVRDLENLFAFASQESGDPLIIPSFELVKYKYKPISQRENDDQDAHGVRYYIIPVLVFVGVSSLGFITCLYNLDALTRITPNAIMVGRAGLNAIMVGGTGLQPGQALDSAALVKGVLITQAFTFLGGYIWTIRYLLRRIANFDLSPISFFRSTAHVLMGMFVSVTVFHSTSDLQPAGSAIILSFLIGYFPDLGLDTLIAKFPGFRLKRVSRDSKALQEEYPIDTILGIDPFIKFRLSEFEIEDVQNLATINPIQIFVETPYGLYEVIDWVAQAQLILAVGSSKAMKLRKLNVRTIFDLEKCLDNAIMRNALLSALVSGSDLETLTREGALKPLDGSARGEFARASKSPHPRYGSSEIQLDHQVLVEALVSVIRDDLHIKRLRQIWDVIATKVDDRPTAKSGQKNAGIICCIEGDD